MYSSVLFQSRKDILWCLLSNNTMMSQWKYEWKDTEQCWKLINRQEPICESINDLTENRSMNNLFNLNIDWFTFVEELLSGHHFKYPVERGNDLEMSLIGPYSESWSLIGWNKQTWLKKVSDWSILRMLVSNWSKSFNCWALLSGHHFEYPVERGNLPTITSNLLYIGWNSLL